MLGAALVNKASSNVLLLKGDEMGKKPKCLGNAVGVRYEVDGTEILVQATFAKQPCGCRVVGTGTLEAPFDIERCPTHSAAPELLEVLSELMEMRGECFIPNVDDWWDEKARRVLEKVRG